jgi:molybdopterin converting factor small subunit
MPDSKYSLQEEFTLHLSRMCSGLAQISVLFYGPLHDIVGKRREKIAVEEPMTLMDLLRKMKLRYGERFASYVFSDGKLSESIAFAVDGVSIAKSELSRTKCIDVTEFVILPPISGG